MPVWISGTVQTIFYCDFFYYYLKSWKNNERLKSAYTAAAEMRSSLANPLPSSPALKTPQSRADFSWLLSVAICAIQARLSLCGV
jgi:hypothetical protein